MQSTGFGNMSIKPLFIDILIWWNSTKLETQLLQILQQFKRRFLDCSVVVSKTEITIFKKVIPDKFPSSRPKNHNFLDFQISQAKQCVFLHFENSGFG